MTNNFSTISLGPHIARAIRVVTSNGTGAVVATLGEGVVVGCHFVVCHCWVPCWGCAIAGWHVGVPWWCHSWVPWRDAIVESTTTGLCCGVYVGFFFASYQHALALTPAWIAGASAGPFEPIIKLSESMESQSICGPPPVRSRKALQRRLALRGSEASANVCLHDHGNARQGMSPVRAYCDAGMYQTESWTGSLWKMIWNGGQNTHCQSLPGYIHTSVHTCMHTNIHRYKHT